MDNGRVCKDDFLGYEGQALADKAESTRRNAVTLKVTPPSDLFKVRL